MVKEIYFIFSLKSVKLYYTFLSFFTGQMAFYYDCDLRATNRCVSALLAFSGKNDSAQFYPHHYYPTTVYDSSSVVAPTVFTKLKKKKVVLVGYVTGAKRKQGDQVYATPGLRISGALTLALARINNDSKLLPGYKLVPMIGETRGDETESISEVARLWRSNVNVIIGPQETCVHEGRFAAAVDLPLISYYCRMPEASDKHLFPTFVRTVPPISQISVALVSLLKHFEWSQVALIHPRHSPLWVLTADKLVHTIQDHNVTVTGVYSWQELFYVHAFFSQTSESPFHHIVEQSFQTTRVYVLLMKEKDDALALLDELQKRHLLSSGNYAVIGIMMKQYDADQPSSLLQGVFESSQPLKPSRLDALQYYLLIAPSPSRKHKYEQFQRDVAEYSSRPPFNYTTALHIEGIGRVQAKARAEAIYLYDAVNIYAHALNQCLADVDTTLAAMRRMRFDDDDEDNDEDNDDAVQEVTNECLHSGRKIVQYIINRPYMSANGLGGMIDSHGDAQGNYTLLTLRKLNNLQIKTSWGIVPVGIFQSQNSTVINSGEQFLIHPAGNLPNLHLFDEIKWPGGRGAPLSEPACGFYGERCRPDVAKLIALYGGLLAGGIIIALIAGLCYRHFKYEKELASFVWRVDRDDLQFSDDTVNQRWQQQQQFLTGQNQQQQQSASPNSVRSTVFVHINDEQQECITPQQHNVTRVTKASSFSISSSPKDRKKSTSPLLMGRYAKSSDGRRGSLLRREEPKIALPVVKSEKCEAALHKGSTVVVVKPLGNGTSSIEITRELCKNMMSMKEMHCTNLALFVGACTAPAAVVWEYCQRGSLRDVLGDVDVKIDKLFLASFTFDIISGMQYLHNSPLKSHGNLRATNILVDSKWVLKITDYGLDPMQALVKTPRHSSTATSSSNQNNNNRNMLLDKFIDIAPEILRHRRRPINGTQKGDIYSFAFVLYELFVRKTALDMLWTTGRAPEEILNEIKAGKTSLTVNRSCHQQQQQQQQQVKPVRPPLNVENVRASVGESSGASPSGGGVPTGSTTLIPDFVSATIQACWDEDAEARPEFSDIQVRLKPLRKGLKSDNIIDNVMALLERYATNLEDVVTERTKELESEKRRTETLLFEMLPRPVAEQLIHKGRVEAESFEQVTVYFSDIIQFTNLCAKLTPMDVVAFLNDLYTLFDMVLELYDVYKVETIGDAYMVVSGAPLRNGDMHAAEIASMALHLIDVLQLFKVRPRPQEKCRIRVGIHSGPCAAGVVGRITPRYTLFGDTINTASRYESSSEAMRIHCSLSCKQILDKIGGYNVEHRGTIELKGKGTMQSFWLVSENDERSSRRHTFFAHPNEALKKLSARHEKVKAALLGRSPSIKSLCGVELRSAALTVPSSSAAGQMLADSLPSAVAMSPASSSPCNYDRLQLYHTPLQHSTSWDNRGAAATCSSLGDDAFNFRKPARDNRDNSTAQFHMSTTTMRAQPAPIYRRHESYGTATNSSRRKTSPTSKIESSAVELALMMFDANNYSSSTASNDVYNSSGFLLRCNPQQRPTRHSSSSITTATTKDDTESVGLLMPMIREEERNSNISSASSRDNMAAAAGDGKGDSKCG